MVHVSLIELLKRLRKNKGAKPEDLAKAINITNAEYLKVEQGLLIPDPYHLDDVAKFYGINPSIFDRYFNR